MLLGIDAPPVLFIVLVLGDDRKDFLQSPPLIGGLRVNRSVLGLPVGLGEFGVEVAAAGTTTADVNAGDARADTRPDPRARRTDPNAGSDPQTHPNPHDP
jgi:hypothetical protein